MKPGSTNTVPGFVQFSLDIRAREDAKLLQLEETLKNDFANIATGEAISGINEKGTKGRGCSVEWVLDTDSPATVFHEDCIGCVEASARDSIGGGSFERITSGAGHDRYGLHTRNRENG